MRVKAGLRLRRVKYVALSGAAHRVDGVQYEGKGGRRGRIEHARQVCHGLFCYIVVAAARGRGKGREENPGLSQAAVSSPPSVQRQDGRKEEGSDAGVPPPGAGPRLVLLHQGRGSRTSRTGRFGIIQNLPDFPFTPTEKEGKKKGGKGETPLEWTMGKKKIPLTLPFSIW